MLRALLVLTQSCVVSEQLYPLLVSTALLQTRYICS